MLDTENIIPFCFRDMDAAGDEEEEDDDGNRRLAQEKYEQKEKEKRHRVLQDEFKKRRGVSRT